MKTTAIKTMPIRDYLLNCFLLILPALVINLVWVSRLPAMWQTDVFWKNIPPLVAYGENISRIAVNILPLFMPLTISTKRQRIGLAIYLIGIPVYFLSWIMLVYVPQSAWSTSLIGATAAAWTSLFWLIGIGLIGNSLYFSLPYRSWVYLVLSVIFAVFHTFHAVIVYLRMT